MILGDPISELPHDKTNKMTVHPAKTQISLGIHPVWSESSLSAWRKLGSLASHSAHSKDSDQIRWMPTLIWVYVGCTCHFVGFAMRQLIYNSYGTRKILKIETSESIAVKKVWAEWQTLLPQILVSLIWFYIACPGLFVPILKVIMVIHTWSCVNMYITQ